MGDDERISPPGQGIKRLVVVLSDVHLGTGHPTAWYQRDVHEEALVHLLGWVAGQAEQDLGNLEGRANLHGALLWNDTYPALNRARAEWVVRQAAGTAVTVTAEAARAGLTRQEIPLAMPSSIDDCANGAHDAPITDCS